MVEGTEESGEPRRVRCGRAALLDEGAIVSVPIIPAFEVVDEEIGRVAVRGAVVARRFGKIHAYANLCRHIPLTLDLGDGDVAAADRRHFLCHHHGARYRLDDGACLSGPCDGQSLIRLGVEIDEGELVLVLPSGA